MRFSLPPPYPFLLAAWPALALAAQNPREVALGFTLLHPILLAWGVTLAAWGAARLVTADRGVRGLLAAVAVGWWWGYRPLANGARLLPVVTTTWAGWVTLLVLCVFGWALAQRLPPRLTRLTRAANLATVLLLLFAGTEYLSARTRIRPPPLGPHVLPLPNTEAAPSNRPDVHLIILDTYSGATSLRDHYGFDNTPFLDALRFRGFLVPQNFRANYTGTSAALTALLNWDYVQRFAPNLDTGSGDRGALQPYAEESRTWRALDRAGYEIVYVSGGMTGRNRYASAQLTGEVSTYVQAWMAMTPLRDIRAWRARQRPPESSSRDWSTLVARHEEAVSFAVNLPPGSSPRFSFLHFLLPHDPYVYHADCTPRDPPLAPWFERHLSGELLAEAYIEQVQCTNAKTLTLIDTLLGGGGSRPVIILLSDHGHARIHHGVMALEDAEPDQIAERLDILGGFLVPASWQPHFAEVQTPLGAMRVLMTLLLGAELEPLAETSYWSSHRRPFVFQHVPPPEGAGRTGRGLASAPPRPRP